MAGNCGFCAHGYCSIKLEGKEASKRKTLMRGQRRLPKGAGQNFLPRREATVRLGRSLTHNRQQRTATSYAADEIALANSFV